MIAEVDMRVALLGMKCFWSMSLCFVSLSVHSSQQTLVCNSRVDALGALQKYVSLAQVPNAILPREAVALIVQLGKRGSEAEKSFC